MKNNRSYKTTFGFKVATLFMLAAFLNLSVACNYYKVRTFDSLTSEMTKDELQKYQNQNRYIILHQGDKTNHILVDKLDADKQILYCYYEELSPNHKLYNPEANNENKRYKDKNGEGVVLNEIHIYVTGKTYGDKILEIPLKSISRIDVIDKDSGRTIASYVFLTAGITMATIGFIALLILLLKSSCPFVYVQNGNAYDFKGEIYGGAIFKPLQRNDYMFLSKINAGDSVYKIRISNELKEIQYTDLAKIIITEHNQKLRTVIDNFGKIHTIANPVLPQTAVLNQIKNIADELNKTDSSFCLFDAENKMHYMNELQLQFDKPGNAKQAKLILNAKNSLYLDFAFTQFTKLFGSYYNAFIDKQNHGVADSLNKWSINQGLPLSVYVKQNDEWKLVEHVNTVGPLAARDICIPIDISNIKQNKIELKLTCGYMFWELDYAAIDFSEDAVLKTYEINPSSAIEQNGNDATALLIQADNKYLIQPTPGNYVDITYTLPVLNKDMHYDVFFMSNGYYNHVRDYAGLPDKEYLMTFKKEGAFIEFAKALQDKLMQNTGLAEANQ